MLNFPRWKQAAILVICLAGLFVVLPNFLSQQTLNRWPSWLPKWQLSLGLDLRGGAHLLYAMEINDVRKDWLDSLRDDARRRLRDAKIAVSAVGIAGNAVQVRIARPEDADAGPQGPAPDDPASRQSADGRVRHRRRRAEGRKPTTFTIAPTEAGLKQRVGNAIDAAIETVRRRVDAVGTKEPHIVREGEGRILVQVPGLQDTGELERLIGETARLSFHEVHPSVTPAEAKAGRVPVGFKIYQGADKREGEYLLRETPRGARRRAERRQVPASTRRPPSRSSSSASTTPAPASSASSPASTSASRSPSCSTTR